MSRPRYVDPPKDATGKTPSRDILYSEAAKYASRAIEVLVEIMEKGDNDNARISAAKTIINKCLPDVKAIELTGEDGGPIKLFINTGGGFVPASISLASTSIGSDADVSAPLQSTGVAQTSQEDNNSNNGDSQAGTP